MSDEHLFVVACVAMVAVPIVIGVGIEMRRAGLGWTGDLRKRLRWRRLRH